MKYFNLTLLLTIHLVVNANQPTLFNQLQRINTCWNQQKDIDKLSVYTGTSVLYSETNLIQLHLKLVEQVLRNRSTAGLSEAQKAARLRNLNNLHTYWNKNNYPVNNKVAFRNPVFIDDYNTFCAVGYLLKTSGHEPLARNIAAKQNLSYLKDIKINGLKEWVTASGLTVDELGWIQPAYMATNHSRGLGKGVNGPVYAMTGNDTLKTLYVAGSFSQANNTLSCNNIIEVKYDDGNLFSNTFSTLGDGLNGTVYALARDGSSLYAGGHFSASGSTSLHNIARWNGSAWESMGNLDGTVYTIYKYKNQIYAGGKFSFSAGTDVFYNLTMWNGTMWLPVVNNINDTVFAMHADYNRLYIGGAFTKVDTLYANHVVAYNGFYPELLDSGVKGTVRAISERPNHAIAVAGDFVNQQKNAFGYSEYLPQSGWQGIWGLTIDPDNNTNCFYAIDDDIAVGKFNYVGSMYYSHNTARMRPDAREITGFASTDSTVYCVYKTAKRVFYGGAFSKTRCPANPPWDLMSYEANNLAVWDKDYVSVNEIQIGDNHSFALYPNPMEYNVTIKSSANMNKVKVFTISGKLLLEHSLPASIQTYVLDRNTFPSTGLFMLMVEDENGNLSNQKLVVN